VIPFNKPFFCGEEIKYIKEVIDTGLIGGNGPFTGKCHEYMKSRYGFKKVLLTTSGTDALEMCAMLCNIRPGDEVIVPSYTFVTSALAFIREGARIVFADCGVDTPNIEAAQIEALITDKTRAIVVVHYAGIACDMDPIMALASKHNIMVVEDAAQSIDSYYKGRPLGSIGHMGAISFHETKNITCGEGGMLTVNDDSLLRRAEFLWEKGTNRSESLRGIVGKYSWVDTGSSFIPSELNAAFLLAQLESIDKIQSRRIAIWEKYYAGLNGHTKIFRLPRVPEYATNNAHMFYLVCPSSDCRNEFTDFMKDRGIKVIYHYFPLHSSKYFKEKHDGRVLAQCDLYGNSLVRLPLYCEMSDEDVMRVIEAVRDFESMYEA